MLKLELVRFSYSPVITYGVLHARDGWSCFTGESVVLNTVEPPPGKAALAEGLYRVRVMDNSTPATALGICSVDLEPPMAHFTANAHLGYGSSDIHVGLGIQMEQHAMYAGISAMLQLLDKVRATDEAYLNIRHLDNTQLIHFERMAREAIQ